MRTIVTTTVEAVGKADGSGCAVGPDESVGAFDGTSEGKFVGGTEGTEDGKIEGPIDGRPDG